MLPAHERLGAAHAAVGQRDQRLVDEPELAVRDAAAQARDQRVARGLARVARGSNTTRRPPPSALAHDRATSAARRSSSGQPCAVGPSATPMLAETTRSSPSIGNGTASALCRRSATRQTARDVLGVGDEHGELVAAGAGGEVLARRVAQAARHGEQEPVADRLRRGRRRSRRSRRGRARRCPPG